MWYALCSFHFKQANLENLLYCVTVLKRRVYTDKSSDYHLEFQMQS